MNDNLKYAAELAEKEGRFRDAYKYWKELVTLCERMGVPDVSLYNYFLKHRDYSNSMM